MECNKFYGPINRSISCLRVHLCTILQYSGNMYQNEALIASTIFELSTEKYKELVRHKPEGFFLLSYSRISNLTIINYTTRICLKFVQFIIVKNNRMSNKVDKFLHLVFINTIS